MKQWSSKTPDYHQKLNGGAASRIAERFTTWDLKAFYLSFHWLNYFWTRNSCIWNCNSWIWSRSLWIWTRNSWIWSCSLWIWIDNSWIWIRSSLSWTCNSWTWNRGFELVTRGFELALLNFNSQLVTCNLQLVTHNSRFCHITFNSSDTLKNCYWNWPRVNFHISIARYHKGMQPYSLPMNGLK